MSSACSLVACLSKGFSGVLHYMATQGCCRNARLAPQPISLEASTNGPGVEIAEPQAPCALPED
jgi:hypothetical protein